MNEACPKLCFMVFVLHLIDLKGFVKKYAIFARE